MSDSGHSCDPDSDLSVRNIQSCYRELYKKRGAVSQEERRRRTLEAQKKKRSELFDLNRDFEFDEDEESVSVVEKMEVERLPHPRKKRGGISKILMFSEWMTEIPEDLQTNWYFVPSPVGKRCVLIAQKGITKLFSKWGKFLKKFQSALPSGSRGEYKYGPTILDCIWNEQTSICYILDVVYWRGQCFNECEAEFRFYWMKTKFEETPELLVVSTKNQLHLQVLPSIPYSPSDLASEIGISSVWATGTSSLDGMLFYHKTGHYYSGKETPLVGWLKPFMLPEALGIEVPDVYLQEQPDNYVSMTQYIDEQNLKNRRHCRKKNRMDVDEESTNLEGEMKDECSDPEELEQMACIDSSTTCECEIGDENLHIELETR